MCVCVCVCVFVCVRVCEVCVQQPSPNIMVMETVKEMKKLDSRSASS